MAKAGTAIRGTIKLEGAKELLASLKGLEPKISKQILRSAMRQAAAPILADAKARAPVDTGALRKSLKIRSIKRNRKGRIGVVVGTEKGFFKGQTFYAGFIELGTKKLPARPFIRPAFDANKATSVRIVQEAVRQNLDDVVGGRKLTKLAKDRLAPTPEEAGAAGTES